MKSGSSLMTSRIILFYVLGVFGRSVIAMEEPSGSSQHTQHLNPMINAMGFDEPGEKRAYTYVSEYKRLPVYNFGIGKRWADNGEDKVSLTQRGHQYSFGLGKRTRPYSFGLGKRNELSGYNPMRMSLDYLPVDSLDEMLEEKRSRQPYSFGLGKRAVNLASESIGNGKRPNDLLSQRYHFGFGKTMSEDDEDSMQ